MTDAAVKANPDIELPPKDGGAVVTVDSNVMARPSDSGALIDVIERLIRDPTVDVERAERLTALLERLLATEAKKQYIRSLRVLQRKLPTINRKGRIEIKERGTEKIIQSTKYAMWEDIHDAIRPIMDNEGFTLSFRTGTASDGRITVTAVLSHEMGHEEQTTMTLPFDATGSKNNVQAIGSSTSYGKRYTATSLLNLVSRGEDDDGKSAIGGDVINEKQLATIQKKIVEAGADIALFAAHIGVDRIEQIPAKKFKAALAALDAKIAQTAAKGKRK